MILKAITIVAAMCVVVQCICALNHMTLSTSEPVRWAYIGLLLAAAGSGLAPLYEMQPSIGDAALLSAVAGYVFVNQRRVYMVGPST